MKTFLSLLALISLTFSLKAQDSKLSSDVTYSIHNYKHPNKAATASQLTTQPGTAVVTPNVETALTNYKRPVPGIAPGVSLAIPGSGPASIASRNYKASPLTFRPVSTQKALTKLKSSSGSVSATGE